MTKRKELGRQLKEAVSEENQKIIDKYKDDVEDGTRDWIKAGSPEGKVWLYILARGGY